jgi:hypothetical protein
VLNIGDTATSPRLIHNRARNGAVSGQNRTKLARTPTRGVVVSKPPDAVPSAAAHADPRGGRGCSVNFVIFAAPRWWPHPHGQDHHHSVYLSVVVPATVLVLTPAAVVVLTPAAVVVVTAAAPVIVPDPTPSAASHSFLRLCASL